MFCCYGAPNVLSENITNIMKYVSDLAMEHKNLHRSSPSYRLIFSQLQLSSTC
ncbi:hypothetical protein ANANG_G00033720 [Anguilla anguilla]|uniref:Uncharacterized protein n=1 Tax=Anguilla anguilla TaxID=7936 RepID=A0A9D3MSD3_ANGAN|nr:hypothetical protein ANANG_G00033720 [Anguilla anguilla]